MTTTQPTEEASSTASKQEVGGPGVRPLVVYLDWNLMQDLLDGHLEEFRCDIDHFSDAGNVLVPYTYEHVREAVFGLAPGDTRRREVLSGIDSLTSLTLLRAGNKPPFTHTSSHAIADEIDGEGATLRLMARDCAEQIDTIRDLHDTLLSELGVSPDEAGRFRSRFERILQGEDTDGLGVLAIVCLQYELIWRRRGALDLATGGPRHLQNLSAEKMFEFMDELSSELGGQPVTGYLHETLGHKPGAAGGLNAALNIAGWSRDKKVSIRSMILDGLHLDHALTYADFFLTRDRRFCARAEEVALMRKSSTRVELFEYGMTLVPT